MLKASEDSIGNLKKSFAASFDPVSVFEYIWRKKKQAMYHMVHAIPIWCYPVVTLPYYPWPQENSNACHRRWKSLTISPFLFAESNFSFCLAVVLWRLSLVMYPSVIQIKPSLAIISVARVTIQMTQIAAGSFLAPSSPSIKNNILNHGDHSTALPRDLFALEIETEGNLSEYFSE